MDCCVPGANIAINKNGKSRVEVSSSKCISCGYCLDSCSHNARQYKDDTERFFDDLKNGQKISLIVSPVFLVLHEKIANKIFGYLKSIGVNRIYDGSFGAEISVWAHVKYINSAHKNNSNKKFIAQHCPAVVNFAQKCLLRAMHVSKLFLRWFFLSDKPNSKPTYICKEQRRTIK